MALDISGIPAGSTALDRIRAVDVGKFRTMNFVAAHARVPAQTWGSYEFEKLRKLELNGQHPTDWLSDLSTILGSRKWGIFKDNENTWYMAAESWRIQDRFLQVTDVGLSTVRDVASILFNDDKHIISCSGPFHFCDGYDPTGPVYIDGTQIWNCPSGGSAAALVVTPKILANNNLIATTFPTVAHGDNLSSGFSNLIPFIRGGQKVETSYLQEARDTPGRGTHIVGYSVSHDFFIVIMTEHDTSDDAEGFDADRIQEFLDDMAITDAVFLDGSDSVYMREYEGWFGGRNVVNSLTFVKNLVFNVMYSIRKNLL